MPAEVPQSPVGTQEDVLRQVAGVLVIAHEPVTQLVDGALVPLDDEVERARPAAEARGHQIGIADVRRGWRLPGTQDRPR